MSKKKICIYLIILLSMLGVTWFIIFSKNNIYDVINVFKLMRKKDIIIAFILVMLYFLMQGIYMKLLLKTLNVKIPIRKGVFYSIVEFFFSGITPSSTGGQPVQLYYMYKDKIPNEKSIIVLMINTILFKLFLVIFGFIILLVYNRVMIFEKSFYTYVLFVIGMLIDIVIVVVCYLMIFNTKLITNVIRFFYKICNKITKKNIDIDEKSKTIVQKYSNNANYIIKHKKEIIIGTIITFIQRILLFSITFFVYRGLGKDKISYCSLLLHQIFIQITIDGMPFPGGTGIQEMISMDVYSSFFGDAVVGGMFLIRAFSFYIPLLVSMVIIIINTRLRYYKK